MTVVSVRMHSTPVLPRCRTPRPDAACAVVARAERCKEDVIKVVGCGGVGVDYLASVAEYPKPDEKLRTERLEVQVENELRLSSIYNMDIRKYTSKWAFSPK